MTARRKERGMKKQIFAFVCAILCALIWAVNVVCDLAFAQYFDGRGLALTILHGVCAAIWTLAALAQGLRMRCARNAPEEQAGKDDG